MFAPKTPVRERILGMGYAGTGKSTAAIDIALKIPEVTMHVIDSEPGMAWERMNPGGEVPNITTHVVDSWVPFAQKAKELRMSAGAQDWLVVDLLGPTAYDMVQEFYIQAVKGFEVEDFYLDFMKDRGKKKNPLDGDTDWQAIKKMYSAFLSDVLNFPGHVFALTGVKPPPRDDQDIKQNRELFSNAGVRPEGQKMTAHAFSTILLFKQQGDKWMFDTVRERNPRVGAKREYVEKKVWEDFGKDYLMMIAGWRPGR